MLQQQTRKHKHTHILSHPSMKKNKNIYLCYNRKVWDHSSSSSSYEDVDLDLDDDDDDILHDHHHHNHHEEHDHKLFYVRDHHRHHHNHDHDEKGMMMMAWPPRSYTCSFCKREFRSAQALGGHMNVHRRDRAQLRQLTQITSTSSSSSPNIINHRLNLNLPPNYNPNHLILSPPPPPPPPKPTLVVATAIARPPPPPPPPFPDVVTKNQFEGFKKINNLASKNFPQDYYYNNNDNNNNLKRREIRLDLEMNISVGDLHNHAVVIKEDLDLELRLGYN